ncbi:PhzF family phenazine biosynthesis protein [Altererythrobacter sp.]|uniref:PhzF family phenazine biosynthesis protein n=1 Tax=Altererythrobacter sp. TaxID=1872480 RepID=UPI001B0B1DD4|nr:PhzF family phenazine biosynthesis protein [Altererythrobacter sp.]MBO6609839.1 PhzF family phenazine biosynthesis protein [Altererythrobacter sp.]MBO6642195.1 PhzF family phenazine biosynthesis protein [Altererythrobacter sp.]MBO6709297.1 PhzF family phenazine biosynthesis protein [Altererythrobacter sp.]
MIERDTIAFIDAFAGEDARGNLAAVVELDAFPDDEQLLARAAEIGAPATAFLRARDSRGTFDVRWFSPEQEIFLCGHGGLAAGHVALSRTHAQSVNLHTATGKVLRISNSGPDPSYELSLPALPTQPHEWPELIAALGAEPHELRWNPAGYALAIYDRPEQVAGLKPDMSGLETQGKVQITASAAGSLDSRDSDITSRVFSGTGREDAATGSAHAALTPYWSERLGMPQLRAFQASARGGVFVCRMAADQVVLSGRCREAPDAI